MIKGKYKFFGYFKDKEDAIKFFGKLRRKQRFALSDLHGNFKALKQVLKKSKFDYDKDELIIVGDIVDGYNCSYECVEEILKIKNTVFIVGNHDVWWMNHMANGWAEEIWLQQGGVATKDSYNLQGFYYDKLPQSHKDFFSKGVYWHEVDGMLFVHGGFNYPKMPWDTDKETLVWDRDLLWRARSGLKMPEWDKVFLGHTANEYGNLIVMDEHPGKGAKVIQLDCGAGYQGRLCLYNIDTDECFFSDYFKGHGV